MLCRYLFFTNFNKSFKFAFQSLPSHPPYRFFFSYRYVLFCYYLIIFIPFLLFCLFVFSVFTVSLYVVTPAPFLPEIVLQLGMEWRSSSYHDWVVCALRLLIYLDLAFTSSYITFSSLEGFATNELQNEKVTLKDN